MKHYLTEYEKELLDRINKLNQNIRERNDHLVKANGYSPVDLDPFEFDINERTKFVMKLIPEKLFYEKFKFERPTKHPASFPVGLFIVKIEEHRYNSMFFMSIDDLRKLRSLSTGVITGGIENNGGIVLDALPKILFPVELFTDITPVNAPMLHW